MGKVWVVVLAASLATYALRFRALSFTTDDAYITFRYARHVALGWGPVYNQGERVEGYTNPLWMYLLAAGSVGGLRPEDLAQALGFLGGVAALLGAWSLASSLSGHPLAGAVVAMVLAFSRDLVAWSTSGLETGWFTALVVVALARAVRERQRGGRPFSAWLAGLAALTRPEGLWWAAVAWGVAGKRRAQWAALACLMVVPQFLFRWAYYHQVVPNTFFLKAGFHVPRGLFYLGEFLRSHPGFPLWVPLACTRLGMPARCLALGVLGALAYVLLVGGDFMEFRFMVPLIATTAVLAPAVLGRVRSGLAIPLGLAACLGTGWTGFSGFQARPSPYMVESVEALKASADHWRRVGAFLARMALPGEWIAVGPAGAIPYVSGLPTVDMLGLSDRWVARHGAPSTKAAGHERVAPWAYLVERRVVWVVGQPRVERSPSPAPEHVSVRMPSGQWLILETTLNPDSLRASLVSRGFTVGQVDREAVREAGRRLFDRLVSAWEAYRDGRDVCAEAEAILDHARDLGPSWRWLLREAGMLRRQACQGLEDDKKWEAIPDSVPPAFRAPLEAAQGKASGLGRT